MSGPSETVLRAALQRIHRAATGQSDAAYMSIPANPNEDADLILSAAIDELVELREAVAALKAAIKFVERKGFTGCTVEADPCCPWCLAVDGGGLLDSPEPHDSTCPVFSPSGDVVVSRSTSKEENGGTTE